ncbi:coagulation factor V [Kryptolebias marmoratus]|uniref:ferroxidase n=1 Tax=Kryptolebias marmoratus TaxID=37003 RepID=A0A3Q2ZT83_KRYMA|nr:coagulation factor V [Kryptolebias marmoratus]
MADMRLCPWTSPFRLLPVLVLLMVLHVRANLHQSKERHYYIAAVEIDWNYSANGTNRFGPTYKKVVFREYDKDFRQAKTHPSWLGLLGPTLRAEEGETIVVTFRNMASGTYSIHPHGVAYGKQSEGANYFDNTSLKEKEDDTVYPNNEHVYYWEVTSEVSPLPDDPTCLTYTYISHQNVVQDYNSGLIGTLLICKPGSLDESGRQVGHHQEYVFHFGVFDEKASIYTPNGYFPDNHVKYTINGYTKGSLPDVSICAHASVSLHLMGMSSEPEVFSVHLNGQVLIQNGHKMSTVGLISGSSATVSLVAPHTGLWLLSSHTFKHIEVGMHGFVDVKKCEGFKEPVRKMTIAEQRQSNEWTYYIAAEEIIWDYAPNQQEHVDEDFKIQYLDQSMCIGAKYKKAVYTLYKNESFTEKLETKQRRNELGILGPVIRAQIRDVIKIVFKNMASRPYSIYPHGLTVEKSEEGVNYPEGGNQSHSVQPGETHTYVWKVLEENEPLDNDPRCLTRMYHSAVDTPRDIASGLLGPILICKSQSLNVRNVQVRADKEQHAVFSVFDENKSWYLDDNIRQYCNRSKVNKADSEFYKSNIMHTINGYAFGSGPLLGFCNGEVATWHVSSIGAQDYIQTATFYGHPFELNERTEDFLSLHPMTGETITMNMDNIGVWLLASLNSHETTKGMRAKFRDVECYRDYQYEYDYDIPKPIFNIWKPNNIATNKEEEKSKHVTQTTKEPDHETDKFAVELGFRSLKKQFNGSDMEKLDLSIFDYDAIDVPLGTMNFSHSLRDTTNKTDFSSKLDSTTDAHLSNWQEVDDLNPTESYLQNRSFSGSAVHIQKNSTKPIFDNFSLYQTENMFFNNHSSLKVQDNSTSTTNKTVSEILSSSDNVTVFGTMKTTVQNATVFGNVFTDSFTAALQESTKHTMAIQQTAIQTMEIQDAINLTTPLQEVTDLPVTLPVNSTFSSINGTMNINLSGNSYASRGITLENSEEDLTRGDVFFYSAPLSNTSTDTPNTIPKSNVSEDTVLQSTWKENNDTATKNFNMSAVGINHLWSVIALGVEKVNISSIVRNILFALELEVENSTSNESNSFNTTAQQKNEPQGNSFKVVTVSANSSLENATHILLKNELLKNVTGNVSKSDSLGKSTEWRTIVTALLDELTNTSMESYSSEIIGSSNLSFPGNAVKPMSPDELDASDNSEELFIYRKENRTEAIKTSSVKPQGHNWTYDGTHSIVPQEIPDHMKKYFQSKVPQFTPPPKKSKKVNLRQRPKKGKGMKTRRRKEYQPQARSGLPFSPRGFNPDMIPRGSRPSSPQPVFNEEQLINMPVVIGVPRPDFSEYDLYPGDGPDHLDMNQSDVTLNEYEYVMYKDPYSSHEDIKNLNLDETSKLYLKLSGPNVKTYFIAAEEVEWDYAGYGHRRPEKSHFYRRETKFTKVVFRGYLDSSFTTPDIRGEMDEHLGILGPLIKAEVGQTITIVFRNKAKRPYSLHPNGVSYTKQSEGLSYEDGSKYWYKYDNEVQPNTTFTYLWKVSSMVGPTSDESQCRTWAYYSGVNPERDIHSGLIGPLLVCREGTLLNNTQHRMREFVLLFMTFDESQSWYYSKNSELIQRKTRKRVLDNNHKENFKFHTINGIIYSLKGLRMYTKQLVCWHLINMGSPKDFQSIHFHGQTFIHKKTKDYRQAVYPLLPGSFATLEMYPSKPGLWQLETEIGLTQQKGMQTLFLVLDNDCYRPLGLESGSIKDKQFTAINTRGYWEPHLARLNNQGKYNAWSTEKNSSWIQVDFQRPVVITQVATQGAKQLFQSQYVKDYSISYANDPRKWIYYKGDSRDFWKIFPGNKAAYETNINTFFPPLTGRFIRLHPITWHNAATVRMEFYGCELDGCSLPLGMESGLIKDHHITGSSTASSWFSPWKPSLARLNKQGAINAWKAEISDMNQWLQVELPQIKKITGIVTQGAKSFGKEMYVMSYSLQYSDNGIHWSHYSNDVDEPVKVFSGNTNNSDHVKNYIYPPIFSRFIRIIPRAWMVSITMRVELLGCDFE